MTDPQTKLLIVEDDPGLQRQMQWSFDAYSPIVSDSRASALAEVRRHEPQVVLLDLGLPPDAEGVSEGMAALADILALAPHIKVIVVTGNDDKDNPVRAIGLGAYDFYQKPIDPEILELIVQRAFRIHQLESENRRLASAANASPLDGLVAASPSMNRVCRSIEKVAPTSASTLLLGESGTGKEVLASALHRLSPRAGERFMAINCAAIPENLLESELFGYEKGAFTGAVKRTLGKIECADKGTLFLDEIGDLPMSLQAKLLRFLQERVIERLGGREEIPVDVRVICATHQDLKNLISEGGFREDLYYRISELTIKIPPLRERENDSVLIAKILLQKLSQKHGRAIRGFAEDALRAIQNYPWPGNVRELENKINGAVIMSEGKQINALDLDLDLDVDTDGHETLNLRQARHEAERLAITRALARADGNMSRAADMLGVTRPTIYDLLKKFDLSANDVKLDA